MRKIFLAFFVFLAFSNANACTCHSPTIERVGLLYKNIIKVKVVKSSLSDYLNDFLDKTRLLFSNNGDYQSKYEDLQEKSYKIEVVERLKGNYQGDQIYLGTGTCSAVRIKFDDEFYIYFDEKPYVSICNWFFDKSKNPRDALFSKNLREYLQSPKPDIKPINLKEWTFIEKTSPHTVYAKLRRIETRKDGNKIVWILYNLNHKNELDSLRTGLSSKVKVEISCFKKMHRDLIEYNFSDNNASGSVVQIDDKDYESNRDANLGIWYPINRGFPVHTVMKRICG
jgi:hypothetical protein